MGDVEHLAPGIEGLMADLLIAMGAWICHTA